jgi:MFS family permease
MITPSCNQGTVTQTLSEIGKIIKAAASQKPFWMLASIYFLFNFCLQMIMVHLINYATDIGISSLIAATFLSFVGVTSFFGRVIMGAWSDRIGSNNALMICGGLLFADLIFLFFTKELWMFYLFAAIFGFAYGGEVPQLPVLIGRYYGMRTATSLVAIIVASSGLGGGVGCLLAGRIFDATQSYKAAFTVAIIAGFTAFSIMVMLKKVQPANLGEAFGIGCTARG